MLDKKVLQVLKDIKSPAKIADIQEIIAKSAPFLQRAPCSESWIKNGSSQDPNHLVRANSSYPVLHEDVLKLVYDFLQFKTEHGTQVEKSVYHNIHFLDMIERLISKRPLSFYAKNDKYILRDGQSGAGKWDLIGTSRENRDIPMREYMTYDEIKLAAFLQVSSPVSPINSGSRKNYGKKDANHVNEAVYVAAVGARFSMKWRMEYQEICVTKDQNTAQYGYGANRKKPTVMDVFANFYGLEYLPSFNESRSDFNETIYLKRIQTAIETFLIEANHRGMKADKQVYAHIVGLGLGVWIYKPEIQAKIYLQAFQKILEEIPFPRISVLDFSWVDPHDEVTKLKDLNIFPGTNIQIRFTKRDPFAKFPEKSDKLVVAMYAWDGNSFPGNEFWAGKNCSTGDSAAAACTQVPQLQNSVINSQNICASNLHVATRKFGLLHVAEYAEKMLAK